MKRVLIILAWTVGAYFGSEMFMAMAYGFLAGITIGTCSMFHYDIRIYSPADHPLFVFWFRITFRTIAALISVSTFILALRGRLPGTSLKKISN
jgi:hypothetical protein